MHKLNRGPAPLCLSRYSYRLGHSWRDVSRIDKAEIWQSLELMQGRRCAYCECDITDHKKSEIEHFRQRNQYGLGTFEWSNLFGSCNKDNSCGKHKDRMQYHYQHLDLIKMDIEDPELYLRFLPGGEVVAHTGLSAEDTHRALETIRVFNLNGSLRKIRETYVKGYIHIAEELAQIAEEYGIAQMQELLELELEAICGMPHETAIRHVLSFE